MSPSNRGLPKFFFHTGNPPYLKHILEQAHKKNNHVVLLGDETNKNLRGEHTMFTEYLYDIETFKRSYRHMSTNSQQFEVICFIRWFVLRNFMVRNNIEACFYADSDIMIYGDLTKEWSKFKENNCAFMMPDEQTPYSWSASGHNSFWTQEALIEFCDFLNDAYCTETTFTKLADKWNFHIQNNKPGGICDMTLFWLYYQDKGGENIGILSKVSEGSTFDDNIVSSENRYKDEYRMKEGLKELDFREDVPYGYNLREDQWVRFNTLHYSGAGTKHLIGK